MTKPSGASSAIRHFLYPLNPNSSAGYYFVDDAGKDYPTSYEGFLDALDYDKPSEWGLATGYRKVRMHDMVWAYFTKPDGAIRAVGRVRDLPHWNDEWERWAIWIDWDRGLTKRLEREPIAFEDYRQRVQTTVNEANSTTLSVLNTWLTKNQAEPARQRDTVVGFVTREVETRLGQAKFRAAMVKAYDHQCAITGCQVGVVLQAAHIRSVRDGGGHAESNGLLLRADLHNLFDRGLIWISDDYTVHIDETLKSEPDYASLHGRRLRSPRSARSAPTKAALRRHRWLHQR